MCNSGKAGSAAKGSLQYWLATPREVAFRQQRQQNQVKSVNVLVGIVYIQMHRVAPEPVTGMLRAAYICLAQRKRDGVSGQAGEFPAILLNEARTQSRDDCCNAGNWDLCLLVRV